MNETTTGAVLRAWTIALVLLLALPASQCWAVVVFPKGSDKPIMGFLVSQDAARVVVREPQPNGTTRDHLLLRSEIDDILFTVSTERLDSLRPDDPRQYRNYAEELAEKRQDPEARAAAIRLYLIAAYLDPANLGRSSLLGMIDLARSEAEEAKFRAMAYLLDPDHDRRVLKPPSPIQTTRAAADDSARGQLLQALRYLRQGNKLAARRIAQLPAVQSQFDEFQQVLTYQQFDNACKSTSELSLAILQKIVLLELSLSEKTDADTDPERTTSSASWQQSLARDGRTPLPVLSLETLTEFDPRKCQYRAGEWGEP
jgi:hypothetical protein